MVALAICQCLHLLDDLFKDVNVSQSVYDEVVVPNKPEAEILRNYLERKIASIDLTGFIIDIGGLGRGELEAMAFFSSSNGEELTGSYSQTF